MEDTSIDRHNIPTSFFFSKCAKSLALDFQTIAETAAMVGMPATSLFGAMKEQNVATRPVLKARRKNPPYGYAWFSGDIVMNPLEYKNVVLILELSKMGKRPHQIANYLNDQRIRPRRGRKWFARTVTDITRREGIGSKRC